VDGDGHRLEEEDEEELISFADVRECRGVEYNDDPVNVDDEEVD